MTMTSESNRVSFLIDVNKVDKNGDIPALADYSVGPVAAVAVHDIVKLVDDDGNVFSGRVERISGNLYHIHVYWKPAYEATANLEGFRPTSSSVPFYGVELKHATPQFDTQWPKVGTAGRR